MSENVLTPELINDLIVLLQDKKLEVVKQAQQIILQYFQQDQDILKWQQTDLAKILLKQVFEQDKQRSSLTCLIHISGVQIFQDQIVEYDAISKIVQLLKISIDGLLENADNKPQNIKVTQYQQIIFKLLILFLNNLTQNDKGKDQFLRNENDVIAYNFRIIYEMYCNEYLHPLLSYFANILLNLSSEERHRRFLIESQNQILTKTFKYIFSKNQEKRKATIKMLRNLVQEFQNIEFRKQLLSEDLYFIDNIVLYILNIMASSIYLVNEKQKKMLNLYLSKYNCSMSTLLFQLDQVAITKEIEVEELKLAFDVLIVFVNLDLKILEYKYDINTMKEVFQELKKCPFEEGIQDKIDVVLAGFV